MWLARSGWGFCFAGRSFLLCGLWGGFSPVAGGGGRHKPCLLCAEMALGTDSWQGKGGRKGSGGLGFWFLHSEPPAQGRACLVFSGRHGLIVRMDGVPAGGVCACEVVPGWVVTMAEQTLCLQCCPLQPSLANHPAVQHWAGTLLFLGVLENLLRKKSVVLILRESNLAIYWQLVGNKAAAIKLCNEYRFAQWVVPLLDSISSYKRLNKYWG